MTRNAGGNAIFGRHGKVHWANLSAGSRTRSQVPDSERQLDRHAARLARAESWHPERSRRVHGLSRAVLDRRRLPEPAGHPGSGLSPRRQDVAEGNGSRIILSVTRVAKLRRGRQATRFPVSVAVGHRLGCRDGGLVPTSGIRLESAPR